MVEVKKVVEEVKKVAEEFEESLSPGCVLSRTD